MAKNEEACADRALPAARQERVDGWGMSSAALGYVYRQVNVDGICDVFANARCHGRTVGLRGAGRSYGDAALNAEGVILDLTRMNRILAWDPDLGVITVEPGVTIEQLWKYTIEDGWWPPVVPGTMFPTLGGALAMNIHGKNNWKVGTLGEHVESFELLLPTGEKRRCSRETSGDLFYAAIGGFGMLGVFTSITLQMKRIYSGLLDVEAFNVANFDDLFTQFEERLPMADYLVGWVDCFANGMSLGRGQVHDARYLAPGIDPIPEQTLRAANQELPGSLFGVAPKSLMWRFIKPFANNAGMRIINAAKFWTGGRSAGRFRQSHAGFAFLLDYVPDWKFSYKPGGLIQYQSFVPAHAAKRVFTEQIRLAQRYDIIPYLGVFKRHRRDDFLMSHAVDGYSFALDFPVTSANRGALASLTAEMDKYVVNAGGRFYLAKDSALNWRLATEAFGEDRIEEFTRLKAECDPESLLQTNQYRRLFAQNA